MPKFELDTTTAQALEEAAKSTNMTVGEFVRFRLLGKPNCDATNDAESIANFDSELDELVFSATSLPGDFSRADIYNDHD